MSNANALAFPFVEIADPGQHVGLTKLELFSAMAMQGLLANPEFITSGNNNAYAADLSVALASALLAELEKQS